MIENQRRFNFLNSQIEFKTSMLKSRLCDYGDLYILVKQNVTVVGAGTTNFQIFLWAPFVDCITEINNTQVGNTKDLDVIMPMYNLIEYKVYYSKSFRRL